MGRNNYAADTVRGTVRIYQIMQKTVHFSEINEIILTSISF